MVLDVELFEMKVFGICRVLQLVKTPILKPNIVVVVKIIDTDHLIPILKQFPTYPRGDKACNSGN